MPAPPSAPTLRLLAATVVLLFLIQADTRVSQHFQGSRTATVLDYSQPRGYLTPMENDAASRTYIRDFVDKVTDPSNPLGLTPEEFYSATSSLRAMHVFAYQVLWSEYRILEVMDKPRLDLFTTVLHDNMLRNEAYGSSWDWLRDQLDRQAPGSLQADFASHVSAPPSTWDPMQSEPRLRALWEQHFNPTRSTFVRDALKEGMLKILVYTLTLHQIKNAGGKPMPKPLYLHARELTIAAPAMASRWRTVFSQVTQAGENRGEVLGPPVEIRDRATDLSFLELARHLGTIPTRPLAPR